MAELGNVIYSIERCICHVPDACRDCGYDKEPCPSCFEHLFRDTLTLLKAQEPRVMSKEEIKKAEVVWLECHGICSNMFKAALPRHPLSINDATWDFETCPYTEVMFLAEYGRNWRCWTFRPTDEQREATPWDEPPKEEGTE